MNNNKGAGKGKGCAGGGAGAGKGGNGRIQEGSAELKIMEEFRKGMKDNRGN